MNRPVVIAVIVVVVIAVIATIVVVVMAFNRIRGGAAGDLITGSVTYQEAVKPAADWSTQVELVQVPVEGENELVVSTQSITGYTDVPIPFSVEYDAKQIEKKRDYIMRAVIVDNVGNMQFQTTAAIPVITKDRPTEDVTIVVQQIADMGEGAMVEDLLPGGVSVSGVLNYVEAVTIPADATAYITLLNTAIADPTAALIGEQVLPNPGQKPISFNVIYDPARIDQAQSYILQARIVDAGNVPLFATPAGILVLTQGHPSAGIELMMQQVGVPVTSGDAYVTGTLTYRERIALPENTRVLVRLIDNTIPDAAAIVIDSQTIQNPGQIPIAFSLRYQPATIIANRSYAVEARINDSSGNLMFITTKPYPVITLGNPTTGIEIVLDFVVKGLRLPFYGITAH